MNEIQIICDELAEVCKSLAERKYEKGKTKKIRCPCCKRLTGKTESVQTLSQFKENKKRFLDLARKFRAFSKLTIASSGEKKMDVSLK